ncbi:MAG TPA: hypothetical protein VFF75_10680 [Methylophilaceae bacterium]|nr:hypothetical protein [Methylophilaceae bacterium]
MTQQINIRKLDNTTFEVSVEGSTTTTHVVTVNPDYARKIAGTSEAERLVRASFEFLLARESNTSILRRFDLPLIGHYFPEYEQQIGSLLQ